MYKPDEDLLKQTEVTVDDKYQYNNSNKLFELFVQAILKNENKTIEETVVYSLLLEMLAESKTKFKEVIPSDFRLYRGRRIDVFDLEKFSTDGENIQGLDKYESKEPPLHTSKDGRSNIAGASYLYVSQDKYTSVAECKPLRESFVSVAEFRTLKKLKVFNLCNDDEISELDKFRHQDYSVKKIIELLMCTFYSSVYNAEKGYKVSQYITELVRKHGYDGIAYRSFISNGKNYAIFNCCDSNIEFINSEIMQVLAQQLDIVAINDGEKVKNPNAYQFPTKNDILNFKSYLHGEIKNAKHQSGDR